MKYQLLIGGRAIYELDHFEDFMSVFRMRVGEELAKMEGEDIKVVVGLHIFKKEVNQ